MNDIKLPPVPSLFAERDWHEAFKQYGRDTLLLNQKPETKPWPQHGARIFLILSTGGIQAMAFNQSIVRDIDTRDQGNIFSTEEAAIKERNRRIVMQRLRVLAGEVDLHADKTLATIYHCRSSGWSAALHETVRFPGDVYFNTAQEAHEAIVVIGVNELNKLLP